MKVLRWLAIGVLLVSLLGLVGCFRSSDVKIGVIIPQEGSSLEEYGYQITSGIQLALAEIQEMSASGELKKNYSLVIENEDQTDPEGVKNAYQRLVDQGVKAVIGAASSASTLALVDTANESKVVLLSPASSSPEINKEGGDYIYRNQPSDTLEAQQLANVIFQKCRIQKVLMVRAKNAYGEGITYELLRFGRQSSDSIPNEVVKFDGDPTKADFPAAVDRIVEVNPEAVFLAAYTDELIPLIREIKSREELSNLYIFTCSSFLHEKVINLLGKEIVEGIMFTSYPWDPQENDPKIQRFVSKFEDKYLTKPDIYAANGYDAMMILASAIDNSRHWIPDEIRDALNKDAFGRKAKTPDEGEEPEVLPSTYKKILRVTEFNKRGDVTRIPVVYRIVDGVRTTLTPEDIEQIKTDVLTRI